jgi:hypothetical protein
MTGWAASELQYADLGDTRRNKRLVRLVEDLAAQPNASVPQASGDLAATQAAYNFWSSPHIKAQAIREAHQRSTIERVKQHTLIIGIQDTTELNFSHHPGKKGMGYLDNANSQGLKVHSVFCSSANGVPLGVLHQQVWSRDLAVVGKKHQRHKKPIQEKESHRWLAALEVTQSLISEETVVVTVADREADIYDLLVLPRHPNSHLLIRATHNRRVKKSGCRLEQLQLETGERIQRALATYTIVAWRLLWITYLARYHPDSPADTVLATHEWQALYCTIHKTPHPPPIPPSLQTCVRWIAQLGGFLGRKHDGEPGVKTIWQGLRRLHDIAQTWLLVSPISTVPVKPEFVKKDATNA